MRKGVVHNLPQQQIYVGIPCVVELGNCHVDERMDRKTLLFLWVISIPPSM
jgi:hypothetical protein